MKKNIIKLGTVLIGVTFISKMTGFFRELLLGIKFGASYESDSYIIAMTIPTIIFTSLIVAAMTCFIPIYTEIKSKEGEGEAITFTNNILNMMMITSVFFIGIVLIFTNPIISIVANGFEGETLSLAVELLRITALMMLFTGVSQIGMGYLQAKECFIIPTANNIIANLLVILAFLLSDKIGIKGVAIISVIGSATQILIQYPTIKKLGFKYKFYLNIKDKYLKKLISLFIPILISTAVMEINLLIDRMLASKLPEGSISALNYANKLNMFVFGIISVSISTIIFPKLARSNSENNNNEFTSLSSMSINMITVLTVPILIFVMFFSKDIVSVLFQYGKFDEYAVQMTSDALRFYSLGMLFMGYRDILNKIYYSMHNTKIPMVNSIISTIVNIILNLILVRIMFHNGLALASSISLLTTTILLIIRLKKIIGLNIKKIVLTIVKSIISSSVIILIYRVWFVTINAYINNNIIKLIFLGIAFIVYITIYFFIGYIIKEELVCSVISNFSSKTKLENQVTDVS